MRFFKITILLFVFFLATIRIQAEITNDESTFLTGHRVGQIFLEKKENLAMRTWGHPLIFSIKDGYVIIHNERKEVLFTNENFELINTLDSADINDGHPGLIAVVEYRSEIIALDAYDDQVTLYRIDPNNGLEKIATRESGYYVPPTNLFTDDRYLIVVYGNDEFADQVHLKNSSFDLSPLNNYIIQGKFYRKKRKTNTYVHEQKVQIGIKIVTIAVPNHLGSLQFLESDAEGNIYLLVEDVEFFPGVFVEQTVWKISPTGKIVSATKISDSQRILNKSHSLTVEPTGELLLLVATAEELQFFRGLSDDYLAILENQPQNPLPKNQPKKTIPLLSNQTDLVVYEGTCLTESQIQHNIQAYLDLETEISLASIAQDEARPSYFKEPGLYRSMSYAWGGFDTPADFASAMKAGFQAGNLTFDFLYNAYGVDCSGFVSRVWGALRKLSTRSIPEQATPLTLEKLNETGLKRGDVLNQAGSHVILIAEIRENGFSVYEASNYHDYDRVRANFRPWSRFHGFNLLRPNILCDMEEHK